MSDFTWNDLVLYAVAILVAIQHAGGVKKWLDGLLNKNPVPPVPAPEPVPTPVPTPSPDPERPTPVLDILDKLTVNIPAINAIVQGVKLLAKRYPQINEAEFAQAFSAVLDQEKK